MSKEQRVEELHMKLVPFLDHPEEFQTVGFIYDTVTSKWGLVASAQEA